MLDIIRSFRPFSESVLYVVSFLPVDLTLMDPISSVDRLGGWGDGYIQGCVGGSFVAG